MSSWTTVKRIARYGFIGFVRNGFVSLAAVMIMTITLFVASALIIGGAALDTTLQQLVSKVDVSVYFRTDATQDQIDQLKQSIESLPEVATVTYIPRDESLQRFSERHQNNQLITQALQELGENPFGASLQVRAKETSQYETIAKYLDDQQAAGTDTGIDTVDFYENKTAIDRLSGIIDASRKLGIAIALILGSASVLIAFNTIRLAIYTSRDEIGVMNLVGASHWYVRGPFVISGILYGLISAAIVLIALYPLTAWLGPGSENFLGSFNVFSYYLHAFPMLFGVLMASGAALGALSSFLAVRRYLRG